MVVVNDTSEDDSDMVLARLKANILTRHTTIPKDRIFRHGKLALTIELRRLPVYRCRLYACRKNWLRRMVALCRTENGNSSRIRRIQQGEGFLNLLVRYDTFYSYSISGISLSSKPYMGVGRNLAYTKQLFVGNNGVKSHSYILSGDDDFSFNR